MKRAFSDHVIAAYTKLFPWRFRHRFGSPLIGSLMRMKGNKVTIRGVDVFLNPEDKTASELFLVHANTGEWIWESYEINLFLESLKANPHSVVVDLGANYGAYSLSCCPLVRDGVVESLIAIEPNRSVFACLKKSVEVNGFGPFVHLVNMAASSVHDAECLFHLHETFSAMSKITSEPRLQRFSGHGVPYKVRGITLDGLLPELGLSNISSLVAKIDVEGAEPDVFRGMETTIRSADGFQVFSEFHPAALLSSGHDPMEFARYLLELRADVVAEVDQHEQVTRRIRNPAEFESIVEECLTTENMWREYTNVVVSKGLGVPFEIRD